MKKPVLTILIALLCADGCFTAYLGLRDPLKSLPRPEPGLAAQLQPESEQMPGRSLQHVTLPSERLGDIGLTISLPDPLPPEKLPVLVVLGGLGTGAHNIRYITDARNNVIVGYDWPIPTRLPGGWRLLLAMPTLYHNAMRIPGQMVSGLDWVLRQEWADRNRVSLLGFSLGALAAPSIQDVAQQQNIKIGWTIIAYGGAPLGRLFANNPHIKPFWLRDVLGPMIDLFMRPVEPQLHLPNLHGHFLVMEGENDNLMPSDLRATLRDAVPQPKDVVVLPGEHMGVGAGQMELLQLIISTSRAWLAHEQAVNQ